MILDFKVWSAVLIEIVWILRQGNYSLYLFQLRGAFTVYHFISHKSEGMYDGKAVDLIFANIL